MAEVASDEQDAGTSFDRKNYVNAYEEHFGAKTLLDTYKKSHNIAFNTYSIPSGALTSPKTEFNHDASTPSPSLHSGIDDVKLPSEQVILDSRSSHVTGSQTVAAKSKGRKVKKGKNGKTRKVELPTAHPETGSIYDESSPLPTKQTITLVVGSRAGKDNFPTSFWRSN